MKSLILALLAGTLLSFAACSPQHSGSDDQLTADDIQMTSPENQSLQADPNAEPADCICPEIYQPVCGVDGRTYGNACLAECRGIEIAESGACSTQEATY